jgi:hypothetical protein
MRTHGRQGSRDGLVRAEGYKKDARPRLRHEMNGVNHRSSGPVVQSVSAEAMAAKSLPSCDVKHP